MIIIIYNKKDINTNSSWIIDNENIYVNIKSFLTLKLINNNVLLFNIFEESFIQ